MSIELQQEKIDDYLLGVGNGDERTAFEAELARSEPLRQQLADTELAMAAIEINEDAILKARLQNLEASLESVGVTTAPPAEPVREAKVVKMTPKAKPNRTWMGVAASLLLLIAVGWFLLRQPAYSSGGELAMANFEPYDNIAYTFERGTSDDSIEASAFRAYEAGDFATAQINFEKIPPTDIRSFYRGQTLLAQQDFAAAEPVFAELAQSESPFKLESEYYLALALVGLERQQEAKTLLARITADPEHPSLVESKQLLGDL